MEGGLVVEDEIYENWMETFWNSWKSMISINIQKIHKSFL
jgi:hypothetical protein